MDEAFARGPCTPAKSTIYAGAKYIFNILLVGLLKLFNFSVDLQSLSPSLTPIEAVLFVMVFAGLLYAYLQIFRNWTGQKSKAQYEQEQNREDASVLRDIVLLMRNREKLVPYQAEKVDQYQTTLEKPVSLTWHEHARQLWLLRNRSYLVVGMVTSFLLNSPTNRFLKRLRLWYRACRDLRLRSSAVEQTVGKGMEALLADLTEQKEVYQLK